MAPTPTKHVRTLAKATRKASLHTAIQYLDRARRIEEGELDDPNIDRYLMKAAYWAQQARKAER